MPACFFERTYVCDERLFMSKIAASAAGSTQVRFCEWRG